MSIYIFPSFIHTFIYPFVDKMNTDCGFNFSVKLTGKRDLVGKQKSVFVQNPSPVFETATLISTCGGPYPAANMTAWQWGSCECSFVVFRAWEHSSMPILCPKKVQRK